MKRTSLQRYSRNWERLVLVGLAACLLTLPSKGITNGTQTDPQNSNLRPGYYVWQPQISPTGPVVLIVKLIKQTMEVYRNGQLIGRSTVGAGKREHPTPTGIFTILQKEQTHHSTKYHEASMPYMERLTWDGVAIHAGNVLGKPDSHGCVHVPSEFAKKLYDLASEGATVLITADPKAPQPPAKPDLEFSSGKPSPVTKPSPSIPDSWHPEASASGPMCVVYSSADRRIYVYRNRVEIGVSNVGLQGSVPQVGSRVYAAQPAVAPGGPPTWKLLGSVDASSPPDAAQILQQAEAPPGFLQKLDQAIVTGSTLVLTDQPVDKQAAKETSGALFDSAEK
jgi:hypothetical protein